MERKKSPDRPRVPTGTDGSGSARKEQDPPATTDARGPARLHLAEISATSDPDRESPGREPEPRPGERAPLARLDTPFSRRLGRIRPRHMAATVISVLWLAALGGYVWGYFGPALLAPQSITLWAGIAGAGLIPIVLVVMLVELTTQARGLARATFAISRLASRMMEPEDQAAGRVATVGGAIRKQLDLLSSALDSTLDRVAAIETMVETQVGAVERVGGRAQMRAQMIRDLLQDERNALNAVAESLNASAGAIVEAVSARVAEVRQANEHAVRELKEAEAALIARTEGLLRAADETAQKTAEKIRLVADASRQLEDVSTRGLANSQSLAQQLAEQHGTLQRAADRMNAEGERLQTLFVSEGALIERMESTAAGLPERLRPVLEGVASELDGAMARVETRAADAASALRAEADLAARAGSEAAQSIVSAAAAGRQAAEDMRASVATEMSSLGQAIEDRVSALDGMAAGVSRALAGAGQSTGTLTTSLESAMHTLEAATGRLLGVVERIGTETGAARTTLDAATDAMERKFARVPELAAEQAARLSSLLGEQASRMGSLAQSLSTTAPKALESDARAALPAPEPARPPLPAPRAAAPDSSPHKPAPSLAPPQETFAPSRAARSPATPFPSPDAAEIDINGLDEPQSLFSLARIGRLLGRGGGRRHDLALAHDDEADQADGTDLNHGFWTTLFARIEGNEHPVIALPPEPLPPTDERETEDKGLGGTRVRHGLEGLHAIAIDLDRLLEEAPPVELWNRYRSGERDVFARRLLGQKGESLDGRIRQRYGDDSEFRDHADRYLARFGKLIVDIHDDRDRAALQATAAGRLNTLLARALEAAR